jgi:hypothetical protein
LPSVSSPTTNFPSRSNESSGLRTEYFAAAQARRISTRAALVPYLIQDLRAAIDRQKEHPPDFQIEVANLTEIRPWLFPETSQ